MNFTETNASRLTAESIARFLTLSNKRHLIITGGRGSGKTTLLREILPLLSPSPIVGLTTYAEPMRAVYMTDSLSGRSSQIGVFAPELGGDENRMRPLHEGFISVGIPAIESFLKSGGQWFSIDEIGYLEALCDDYLSIITKLMDSRRLAAVVRRQSLPHLCALLGRDDICLIDLDRDFDDLGCVIMASGLSKRFGANKLLAKFCTRPLISYIIDATEGVFKKRIVVTRSSEVLAWCSARGIPALLHDLPHRNDTIRLGLESFGSDISGCLFCPADQPLLSSDTVRVMALAAHCDSEAIWQLRFGDAVSSPVLFPRTQFQSLCNLPVDCGGNVILKEHPEKIRYVHAENEEELFDIDTPDNLLRLSLYCK